MTGRRGFREVRYLRLSRSEEARRELEGNSQKSRQQLHEQSCASGSSLGFNIHASFLTHLNSQCTHFSGFGALTKTEQLFCLDSVIKKHWSLSSMEQMVLKIKARTAVKEMFVKHCGGAFKDWEAVLAKVPVMYTSDEQLGNV